VGKKTVGFKTLASNTRREYNNRSDTSNKTWGELFYGAVDRSNGPEHLKVEPKRKYMPTRGPCTLHSEVER
jgi:hypothetical protein